jgi:hypothetical protein
MGFRRSSNRGLEVGVRRGPPTPFSFPAARVSGSVDDNLLASLRTGLHAPNSESSSLPEPEQRSVVTIRDGQRVETVNCTHCIRYIHSIY